MFGRYIAPIFAVALLVSVSTAYGHGLGFDESIPVTIGDRKVSVEATLSPSYIEGTKQVQPVLTLRAHDPGTNSTIGGMDYRIAVTHGNEVLLDRQFSSPDGLVIASLIPDSNITEAQVNGQAGSDRVQVSKDNFAVIKSRIMSDGGLYHIAVTLEKTSRGLQLAEDRTFDLYVSISKKQDFQVDTSEGVQTMSVTTYYADVTDFVYENGTITFAMPFDWRQDYVQQVPLVHVEVHFPKVIKDLQANGYHGIVNGKDLSAEAVLIDDYSFEDMRVVHFVLGNDKLTSLAEIAQGDRMDFTLMSAEKPKFPLDILSTTEKYLWEISWGPEVIETGIPTTFVMNMQDAKKADLVKFASFDFVLEKDGREMYRQHLSSNIGTFAHVYTFAEAGTYRLAAEKISGEQDSAEINIIVLQGSGTSPPPSPTTTPQQQQPSGCLIATAAFGSELTPQVQFLRGFRDDYILSTASGSAFMNAFNAMYYSFSPAVADYEREQPWLQATVRTALYPLFGILLVSERAFATVGGGEAGTVLAGTIASTLIGAIYVSPALATFVWASRKRVSIRLLAVALAAAVASLAAAAIALAAGSETALSLATSMLVLSAAASGALAVAKASRMYRLWQLSRPAAHSSWRP